MPFRSDLYAEVRVYRLTTWTFAAVLVLVPLLAEAVDAATKAVPKLRQHSLRRRSALKKFLPLAIDEIQINSPMVKPKQTRQIQFVSRHVENYRLVPKYRQANQPMRY